MYRFIENLESYKAPVFCVLVAEMLTLETDFIDMLGFTYPETTTYLKYIIEKYAEEEVSRAVSGAVSGTSVR